MFQNKNLLIKNNLEILAFKCYIYLKFQRELANIKGKRKFSI